jgi:hypothetical protein
METNVDELIRNFSRFLALGAPLVLAEAAKTDAPEEYWEDWAQANWERFVEARLEPGIFLEIYGSGADCNDSGSRVSWPDAVPTRSVVCLPKAGHTIRDQLDGKYIDTPEAGFPLEELVALEGGWYERKPPFDHVLVEVGDFSHVFSMDDVTFALGPPTRG